jgi:hypothetical protein
LALLFSARQRANFRSRLRGGAAGCLEWTGYRDGFGYGRLTVNGRTWSAHRAAYADAIGPIPDGMLVLHKCDNPACANPAHLELGTDAENNAQKARRGRAPAKLSDEQVRQIRTAAGRHRDIGDAFGVSAALVCCIKNGTRRTYVGK